MNNPRRGRGRSGRRPNIPTRSQNFDSNGPEGRVRGNAQQVYEKYLALARDAQVSGDRVLAEAFQQHAEHYYRVMNDSTDPDFRPREAQQGQQSREDRQEAGEEDGEARGDRRQQERGYDRRDDRSREGQERRAEERGHSESRPNGQAGENGASRQEPETREARNQGERSEGGREGEGREGRLRERFNRRNGEGILTRRRGGELEQIAERSGNAAEDEAADAGLRKMLGENGGPGAAGEGGKPREAAETGAAEAAGDAPATTAEEAPEAAAPKPRRRRRTKAEMEAKDSTEQTAE